MITQTNFVKFWGITVDHTLSWKQHIDTEWHKKKGNFWKTQQKLKKSKKKNLLTEIEPLQLAL